MYRVLPFCVQTVGYLLAYTLDFNVKYANGSDVSSAWNGLKLCLSCSETIDSF